MNSPKHKRGFIFRALSVLDAATRPYYISTKVFRVQVENGLDDVFFLHFSLVSIQFDIS